MMRNPDGMWVCPECQCHFRHETELAHHYFVHHMPFTFDGSMCQCGYVKDETFANHCERYFGGFYEHYMAVMLGVKP